MFGLEIVPATLVCFFSGCSGLTKILLAFGHLLEYCFDLLLRDYWLISYIFLFLAGYWTVGVLRTSFS